MKQEYAGINENENGELMIYMTNFTLNLNLKQGLLSVEGAYMSEGWVMTPWTACVFFRYCMRYKIEGEMARKEVLRRIAAKAKAKYIRDGETFLKGKRIIQIKGNKECEN